MPSGPSAALLLLGGFVDRLFRWLMSLPLPLSFNTGNGSSFTGAFWRLISLLLGVNTGSGSSGGSSGSSGSSGTGTHHRRRRTGGALPDLLLRIRSLRLRRGAGVGAAVET